MAQIADIDRYLVSDVIFEIINKKFIKMNSNDIKSQNSFLKKIFEELINAMRKQSLLFDKTFQKINWVGSFYKGTRVGHPEEYDLNFVINLPFKEKNIKFETDPSRPGYIKICIVRRDINSQNVLNLDPKANKELNSLIDEQSYLNQDTVRTWIESILSKVAYATSGTDNTILFRDYTPITKKKSGPAFTLKLTYNEKNINIDIVPILSFSIRFLPSEYSKMDILQSHSNRCWSAVPKPLNNSKDDFGNLQHRYWRLCFYEFEKDIFCSYNYGRMKPVIRQLKKFRDTRGWTSVASYYLETLCYHNLEMFNISHKISHTFLFFKMLEQLHDAFRNHYIKNYWYDHNLLENIKHEEMKNMEGRLENILKKIRKTINHDPYAIAKYVLNEHELENLKRTLEPESEPESESNQWDCMII